MIIFASSYWRDTAIGRYYALCLIAKTVLGMFLANLVTAESSKIVFKLKFPICIKQKVGFVYSGH